MKEYYIESKHGKINILEGDDCKECKGILLHLHGLGSNFQSDYVSFDNIKIKNKFFNGHQYKSFGFEYHGHGKSEGRQNTIYDFNDLVIDLENVINMITNIYPKLKIFIISKSMGSAVAIKYIALRIHNITGLILISPMCGINDSTKPHYCLESILLYTSHIFPLLPYNTNVNIQQLSTNNKEYLETVTDNTVYPLCTLREIINISKIIPKIAYLINCPVLLICGDSDIIIDLDSVNSFYNNIVNKKNLIILKKRGHELLIPINYYDKVPENILTDIVLWCNAQ